MYSCCMGFHLHWNVLGLTRVVHTFHLKWGPMPPLEFFKGGPMPPLDFFKGGPMPPLEFLKGGPILDEINT